MSRSRCLILLLGGLACWQGALAPARAQTLNVASTSRDATTGQYTWVPVRVMGGGLITDAVNDLQTGQPTADFVGSATNSGFLIKLGTIGSADYVAFRLALDGLNLKSGVPTFSDRVGVGLDVNLDGKLDLFLSAVGSGGSTGIGYQYGGNSANTSPSTSSLGNFTLLEGLTATNFNYSDASTIMGSSWSSYNGNPDAVVTFAVSIAAINTAVSSLFPGTTFSASSWFRLIGFSATNANTINQDVFGTTNGTSATRFDAAGGGFSDFMNSSGDVVPESPAIAWVASTLACGLAVLWRRRRRELGATLAAAGRSVDGK